LSRVPFDKGGKKSTGGSVKTMGRCGIWKRIGVEEAAGGRIKYKMYLMKTHNTTSCQHARENERRLRRGTVRMKQRLKRENKTPYVGSKGPKGIPLMFNLRAKKKVVSGKKKDSRFGWIETQWSQEREERCNRNVKIRKQKKKKRMRGR